MKKTELRAYARLIARVGGGVKKGIPVVINATLHAPEFTLMVAEECYKAGASRVDIRWSSPTEDFLNIKYQNKTTLQQVPAHLAAQAQQDAELIPCRINLRSPDPDPKGGYAEKRSIRSKAVSAACSPHTAKMKGRNQWTIVGVPNREWAKKVFPDDRASAAEEKLWEAIFKACHMRDGKDPELAWKEHMDDLDAHCAHLNKLPLTALRLYAENGTDLTVGLISDAVFKSCRQEKERGVCVFDLPTEECYTTPDCHRAEGIVYGSVPWRRADGIIEDYWMKFEGGRVVDFGAKKGEDLLRRILATDDGAARLGEVALVSGDNPVRGCGVVFHEMVFDENSHIHLALGSGFADCVENHSTCPPEELLQKGVNKSRIHAGFVMGTEDMNIDGIAENGEIIPIFRKGIWAF